jgi:GNAT superfamily N-acetyltransferase
MTGEWRRGEFTISTDRGRLDVGFVHAFLTRSYWARNIPLELERRSHENSLRFCVYHGATPVGFARVITDFATFGYVGDVFVLEAYRGRGLGAWLMEVILAHPDLQGFRRWALLTRDAHALYAKAGFHPLASPERWMERRAPDPYGAGEPGAGPRPA